MGKKVGHVVLASGGADSATVLGIAHHKHREELKLGYDSHLVAFHCNYGQKTEKKELQCFHKLCEHYGIDDDCRIVVDIGYLKSLGGSSLTDDSIEVASDGKAIINRYVPTSYVPARNTNLLAIGASICAVKKSTDLWFGAVMQDGSGYPDCRIEFVSNMNEAINCGLPDGHDIVIHVPVIHMKKDQIISEGMKIGVPYELTWSCYQNNDAGCAYCDSCRLRIASFARLNLVDPTPYVLSWEKCVELARIAM